MSYMAKELANDGFQVIQMPENRDVEDNSFAQLPPDPYYRDRLRRFSQYILYYEHSRWAANRLEPRAFVQSKKYNLKIGGVRRKFEAVEGFDPTPYFSTLAEFLKLNKDECFQINFHNWRTLVGEDDSGDSVPEGPHRDGHHITSVTIWNRHNITGGVSQVFSVASHELLFETTLDNGQCLVISDEDVLHGATDIHAPDGETGYRDTWVISMNPWWDRRYGAEHEDRATG